MASNTAFDFVAFHVSYARASPLFQISKYPAHVTGICKNTTTTSLTAIDGVSRLHHPIAGSEIAKFRTRQTLYKANSPNINPAKFSRYMVYTLYAHKKQS